MKKVLIITIVTMLAIVLVIVSIPMFRYGAKDGIEYVAYAVNALLVRNPPKPKITYSEFPFTLVYEIDGEEVVIEDILICEYDGIVVYGGVPEKANAWKSSVKSGGEGIKLMQIDENWELYYPKPNAAALMNEVELTSADHNSFSKHAILRDKNWTSTTDSGYWVSEEELLSKHGIKIISWDIALPIENSFK